MYPGIFQSRNNNVSRIVNRLEVTVQQVSTCGWHFMFNRFFGVKNERLSRVTVRRWRFIDGYIRSKSIAHLLGNYKDQVSWRMEGEAGTGRR
jgi:hypothetical protein